MNRRDFVSLVAAGATGMLSERTVLAKTLDTRIKAIAFDGLAVIDVRPVARLTELIFPGRGEELGSLWRTKQFEYTWLRTIGRQYANFWQVTEEALIHSCKSMKLGLTNADRDRLMECYLELKAWPDAMEALKKLKSSGLRMAFLSDFTAPMLDRAVKNSGLEGTFENHLSTDLVRVYKPDPRTYAMGTAAFGLHKEEIVFAAFAGWDAVGAKWFGYLTFWVNRAQILMEELGVTPDGVGKDLTDLAAFVESRRQESMSGPENGSMSP